MDSPCLQIPVQIQTYMKSQISRNHPNRCSILTTGPSAMYSRCPKRLRQFKEPLILVHTHTQIPKAQEMTTALSHAALMKTQEDLLCDVLMSKRRHKRIQGRARGFSPSNHLWMLLDSEASDHLSQTQNPIPSCSTNWIQLSLNGWKTGSLIS